MSDADLKVIVISRFNRAYPHPVDKTPAWYAERLRLWRQYCMASLAKQTHADFEAWLLCDPKLRHLTDPTAEGIDDERFRFVYDNAEAMSRVVGHDRYLRVRIDSDDAYHPCALEVLAAAADEMDGEGYILFERGYAWDDRDGTLLEFNSISPPFCGVVETGETFGPGRVGFKSHGRVYTFARRIIRERMFVVVLHGVNRHTGRQHPHVGKEITGPERWRVMAEFGLAPPDQEQ